MAGPAVGSPEWKAQDKGPSILITCWVVTAIATIFVIARIYVRGKIQGRLRSDDWWVMAGLFCGYVSTALSTLAVNAGNGKHFDLLTTDQKSRAIMWTTAAFCPGVMSFGLPKLAVVALLTRLLNPSKYHRWFLWWQGIWAQLTLFATVGVLLGQCMPARSLWDFSITEKQCFDKSILIGYCMYAGIFSASVDIYLAIYPTAVLFKLQLPLRKKIALCVALGIGLVSGVVAIYKTTRIPSLGSADFSYDTSDLVVWTVIEGSAIMIACSIPCLQPLLDMIIRRGPWSSHRTGSGASNGPSGTGSSKKTSPRYYEDYSQHSKHNIELGQRKPKSKLRDDLGFTVVEGDESSSQENILATAHNGSAGTMGTGVIDEEKGIEITHSAASPPGGQQGIIRTDVVAISYEQPKKTHPSPGTRDNAW